MDTRQLGEQVLGCCGGRREPPEHKPNCPSTVRAALSWIEETAHGERHRKRGLAAFEAILAERDALLARLQEAERALVLVYEAVDNLCARPGTCLPVRSRIPLAASPVRIHPRDLLARLQEAERALRPFAESHDWKLAKGIKGRPPALGPRELKAASDYFAASSVRYPSNTGEDT